MTLIADSGSTKTDWIWLRSDGSVSQVKTYGCNPYFIGAEEMAQIFASVRCQVEDIPAHVFFYGAGCTPGQKTAMVAEALTAAFGQDCDIEVQSDMVGAARSLCQHSEGIACIMGTGSNSCLYDGQRIVANVPPLGFILGDEGSGANLGKLFVGAVLKDQLSPELKDAFLAEYGSVTDIIDRVYRQPQPNRWLASLSPFIHRHMDRCPPLRRLVKDAFKTFFMRNTANYHRPELPVSFTGSVAYHYQDVIREAAQELHVTIGCITQSPMAGLVAYHR